MSRDDTQLRDDATGEHGRAADVQASADRIDWHKAQEGTRLLLEAVGRDPEAGSLPETWQRRVPAMLETLTAGRRDEAKPTLQTFERDTQQLIVKTDIPVYSLCEHHLLPYHGTAHVAYRPNGSVVGLSKLVRYVRWQSRKLTIQEELTEDIAHGLANELGAEVVLTELSATHLCEAMRGVEATTETITRATVGSPTDHERQRFDDAITRTTERQ